MAKIIFNNNNYSVDDSFLSTHSNDLKQHLSTVMNGTGAVINLGGTAYNVDSAKLATAKDAFVQHLGTITGNGRKVVIGGVEYNVDAAKVAGAVSEIEAVLGGSHNGGGGSTTTYTATFADNAWSDIVRACQNNEVPDTWVVGDVKTMIVGGQEVEIIIIGKNHDEYADGSGIAPLTFQTVGYDQSAQMNSTNSNAGGWDSTELYAYLNGDLLNGLELKDSIKAVKKSTNIGYTDSGKVTATTTRETNDKIFLLSSAEVFNLSEAVDVYVQEGTQYDYYASAETNTATNNSNAAKASGGLNSYWLRSPYATYGSGFRFVSQAGKLTEFGGATNLNRIVFGFCF
jgi:hypothetical protein